ncbi:arsenite efflux ATP-binding protein ArsA [Terracoccus luteus]|uniref:Arsenite efflux ATP-binding protein ArsA n=1 Tax=Terracoccus luteus TaxID=53356 RepID=A0A495XXV2_9MICO|nr:ArsA family ATPase [Terracoccus luteus]RKT79107.1 arsenite efflux ATP-binding protein ArsA [Terracoccus luteus]
MKTPLLDVDTLIDDPGVGILVCCGAGGVGKTTTAAAIGLRAAEAGRHVVVLTIDPALRLAQSLGLTELDNTPRPVHGIDETNGGSLHAMMLDMKRTFDEVVIAHSEPDKAEQILANPFYQAVSSSFAGTQEYMAMEKLGQLKAASGTPEAPWDLIVVDTPPSRSALDFLDAPNRLGSFLDGRFIRLMTAPAKVSGRAGLKVFGFGVQLVSSTMTKILGGQMLQDLETFVSALETMFGGFRERADQTYRLLSQQGTSFIVVAAPERDALREASFFVDRLEADGMPLAGLVVNRVGHVTASGLTPARALSLAETLEESGGPKSATNAAGVLRLHAALVKTAERQRALAERFSRAHPGIPVVQVPALSRDVHDLDNLREVGDALTGAA